MWRCLFLGEGLGLELRGGGLGSGVEGEGD